VAVLGDANKVRKRKPRFCKGLVIQTWGHLEFSAAVVQSAWCTRRLFGLVT